LSPKIFATCEAYIEGYNMRGRASFLCSILLVLGIFSMAWGSGGINLDNWKSHAEIKKVRSMYNEIQESIKNKTLKTQRVDFDFTSDTCTRTYPVKWREIAVDGHGKVRLFIESQIISHRETMTTQRFYDEKGQLRFVFVTYDYPRQDRIYLGEDGSVLFGVEQDGNEYTSVEYDKDEWFVNPAKQDLALEAFGSDSGCPEK
jgi:hypothetical protein